MFGSHTHLPNRMDDYSEAHDMWASIDPIRGRKDTNTRPLGHRRNDNLTIRKDMVTGDIVVRLYQTDIIRYCVDGSLVLDPYPSVMTNRVMGVISPRGFDTHWSCRAYPLPDCITEVGGVYYHTPEYAMLVPAGHHRWYIEGGNEPMEVPRFNRAEGKAALRESGYYEFKSWIETLIRLGTDPRVMTFRGAPYVWEPRTLYCYLTAGPNKWEEIAGRMSGRVPLEKELAAVRQALYKYYQAYDTETVPYFDSYDDMKAAFRRVRAND